MGSALGVGSRGATIATPPDRVADPTTGRRHGARDRSESVALHAGTIETRTGHGATRQRNRMSSLRVNGQYVLIKDPEKKDFVAFVNLCIARIQPEGSIPHLAADVLAGLLAEGKPHTDPVVQAGFEICSSLGIKNLWVDGTKANVTEEVATDAAAGLETAFGFAAIESGLAMGAAMCNAFRRTIQVNEQSYKVIRQGRESMEALARKVSAAKQLNEPIFMTGGRVLGMLLKEGKSFDDPEVRTVLCMLSDFGVKFAKIDLENNTLGFGMFSPANGMASAILQGLDAEKVKKVRESIEKVNEQFRQFSDRMAAGEGAKAQQQSRISVPSVMGTRRRR